MGLLDSFDSENNAAMDDLVRRPPPAQPKEPKFSAWNMLTAAPRGVGSGANETAGSVADVLGAFGQVLSGTESRTSMFGPQSDDERKQEEQARQKMLKQGLEFDAGNDFRAVAKQWAPDPTTAHTAEKTVFGLTRFGSKAFTAAAVAGPAVGAGLLGVDEALTAADDLEQQGVDPLTRYGVGAVAGVAGAAGVLLPVAGKTAVQTAALVAIGGPGAFMAQQAATRDILQAADYSGIANQYDPFDPVGLAVSTLVPAGFGAFALRGVRVMERAATKAKAAAEAAIVAEKDAANIGPPRPTQEHVDAARVEMLTQHIESAGLHSPEDARAAAMHLDAFAKAMDDLSAGRRVDVTDFIPFERLDTAHALDTFASRLDETRTELMTQAAQRAEPGAVRVMQSELADTQAKLAELEDPVAIKARATELQQSDRVSYKKALSQAKSEFSTQADDVRARITRLESLLDDNATGQQAFDALNLMDKQAEQIKQQRAAIDAPATRQTPTAAAAKEAAATTPATPKESTPNAASQQIQTTTGKPGEPAASPQAPAGTQQAATDAGGAAPAGSGEAGRGGISRSGGDTAEASVVAKRLADIQNQFPDLTVQMDGMDAPVKLADFLAEVQREAMEGTDFDLGGNDAPLMQVAANCFLLNG